MCIVFPKYVAGLDKEYKWYFIAVTTRHYTSKRCLSEVHLSVCPSRNRVNRHYIAVNMDINYIFDVYRK